MKPVDLSNASYLVIVCKDIFGSFRYKSVRCMPSDVLFNPGKCVAISVFAQADIQRFLQYNSGWAVSYYCVCGENPVGLFRGSFDADESGIEVRFSGSLVDTFGSVFVKYEIAGGGK